MPPSPIITFKAGACSLEDGSGSVKVHPQPEPGFIYLYREDDLPHFCWRPRSAPLSEPVLDLIMFPGDGSFTPYQPDAAETGAGPKTNGRIFVLKFSSSSSRHLFWLQSRSQAQDGNPSWYSPRDLKIGEIVNQILQGEDVDVLNEITNLPSSGGGGGGDGDTTMEDAGEDDVELTGGAGAGATGGDVREEGEEAREGGGDGARAAKGDQNATQAAIANFLKSLKDNPNLGGEGSADKTLSTNLVDLLQPSDTMSIIEAGDEKLIDHLLTLLPPALVLLATDADESTWRKPDPETVEAVSMSLSPEQKKDIIARVLRSPQFTQSAASLTSALQDGGLPMIAEALKVPLSNQGLVPGGTVPLGGAEAIKAFTDGVRDAAERDAGEKGSRETQMDDAGP